MLETTDASHKLSKYCEAKMHRVFISKQENAVRRCASLTGPLAAVEGEMPGPERPNRAVTVIQARKDNGTYKKQTVRIQS